MIYFQKSSSYVLKSSLEKLLLLVAVIAVCFIFQGCGRAVSHGIVPADDAVDTTLLTSDAASNGPTGEQQMILDAIDRFAARSGVKSLRKTDLKGEELEIRVWIGFGPEHTRGLVLKRSGGMFLAPEKRAAGASGSSPVSPKNGWKEFWSSLETNGIFALPEHSLAGVAEPKDDPNVIVIETKRGKNHHTYKFEGLCYARSAEAQKLQEIMNVINEGLNMEFFHCRQ